MWNTNNKSDSRKPKKGRATGRTPAASTEPPKRGTATKPTRNTRKGFKAGKDL